MKFIVLALLAAVIPQTTPQSTRISIQGEIVRADTGDPIPGAVVALGTQMSAVTAADGSFALENVLPGPYMVTITADAYTVPGLQNVSGFIGSESKVGQITIGRQEHPKLHIEMLPCGTISGTLLGLDGNPVPNVRPQLLLESYRNGVRMISPLNGNPNWPSSNDRGEYRLYGIPPGDYYLLAQPRIAAATGDSLSATYFPSALNVNLALPVHLKGGAETPHIDIKMQAIHTSPVTGTVIAEQGAGLGATFITHLLPVNPDTPSGEPGACIITRCNLRSPFTIRNVPEGTYTLQVEGTGQNAEYYGETRLVVGPQYAPNVDVTLHPGISVQGHVTVEGDASKLKITLDPIQLVSVAQGGYNSSTRNVQMHTALIEDLIKEGGPVAAMQEAQDAFMNRQAVNPKGMFLLPGIPPGQYTVVPGLITGGFLIDVRQDGKSIMDSGLTVGSAPISLELVFGTAGGRIQGFVENEKGEKIGYRNVVLVPAAAHRASFSTYKTVATDDAGHFDFSDVLPGEYKVFSWTSIPPGAWTNADFLKKFEERGVTVTATADENTDNLHVLSIRFE